MQKFLLAERVIDFAVVSIKIAEQLPHSFAGNHLAGQLTRIGTAPALHYGEAQAAKSRADFIHKMKLSVKELHETFHCLKIIAKMGWFEKDNLSLELSECNELISIFIKASVKPRKINQLALSGPLLLARLFLVHPFLVLLFFSYGQKNHHPRS
ncbi:four helix bundle protein [Sediminibacterium soli]|uniref:four helix bundle protein n=1 Tax=Sediminibacterium soli TaxID=2698829 RepID=UPI00137AC86D|nr:four helix bundle protein [Sediminibacterium soli]NCI47838.1 four helix bundle protein [Sediminibacterium soli]